MSAPVLGRPTPPGTGRHSRPQPRRQAFPHVFPQVFRTRPQPSPIAARETPILVTQLDLDAPDGPLTGLAEETAVLALVRLHRHPLGVLSVRVGAGHDLPTSLRRAAALELGAAVLDHERRDREPGGPRWERRAGWPDDRVPPCLRGRAEVLADPPPISVIIGTRERPAQLDRCLYSLASLNYPRYEVLVVDSDPDTEATRRVAERAAGPVRYLRSRRRGVALAHTLGAAEATGRILAFTGDDVVVDRDWLAAIAEAFADRRVGCVTGLTMPGELRPPTRADLARRGRRARGFEAGDFETRVFQAGRSAAEDPLFPFPGGRMGSGANLAFEADLLQQLHGFDPAMGPGAMVRRAEDLLALFRAIEAGRQVVYQPDAVVWHHRQRDAGVRAAQAVGYGVGLSAYLTAALVHEPALLRRLPRGLVHKLQHPSPDQEPSDDWPVRLPTLERRGLHSGPLAYLHDRWLGRRSDESLSDEDIHALWSKEHRP